MAAPLAESALELAKQSIIGFETTTTTEKKKKLVVERTSLQVRAWEVALAVGIWYAGQWLLSLPDTRRRIDDVKARARGEAEVLALARGMDITAARRMGLQAEGNAGTILGDLLGFIRRNFPDLGGPIGHPLARSGWNPR